MANLLSPLAYAGTGTLGTITLLDATVAPTTGKEQLIALGGSILFQFALLGFKELKAWLRRKSQKRENQSSGGATVVATETIQKP